MLECNVWEGCEKFSYFKRPLIDVQKFKSISLDLIYSRQYRIFFVDFCSWFILKAQVEYPCTRYWSFHPIQNYVNCMMTLTITLEVFSLSKIVWFLEHLCTCTIPPSREACMNKICHCTWQLCLIPLQLWQIKVMVEWTWSLCLIPAMSGMLCENYCFSAWPPLVTVESFEAIVSLFHVCSIYSH